MQREGSSTWHHVPLLLCQTSPTPLGLSDLHIAARVAWVGWRYMGEEWAKGMGWYKAGNSPSVWLNL